jgi:hypothetical protein
MIDAAVRVADKLILLLTIRERNREKEFEKFVDPLFKDAELVVNDYFSLFRELLTRLGAATSTEDTIRWLEERRLEMLPVRMKLRAFLQTNGRVQARELDQHRSQFERGLWGVMQGGLSLVEEGYVGLEEYGFRGHHTILDIVYELSGLQHDQASDELQKDVNDRVATVAQIQLRSIEAAWKDATLGYAQLKNRLR